MKTDLVPIRQFLDRFCLDPPRRNRTFDLFRHLIERIEARRWPLAPRAEVDAAELVRVFNAVHGRGIEAAQFVSLASLEDLGAIEHLKRRYVAIDWNLSDALGARLDAGASAAMRPLCEQALAQAFGRFSTDRSKARFEGLPAALARDVGGSVAAHAAGYASGALIAAGSGDAEAHADLCSAAYLSFNCVMLGLRNEASGVLLVLSA